MANGQVNHLTSNQFCPKSNGLAEKAVQVVKRMWQNDENSNNTPLAYRKIFC